MSEKEKPKLGRPTKPIDWKIVEQLCSIQCTPEEIASFFHIARATLYERTEKEFEEPFPTVYKKLSEGGKCSLRRTQWKLAQKSAAMAIWLGKQMLGQSDPDKKYESHISEKMIVDFDAFMKSLSNFQSHKSGLVTMQSTDTSPVIDKA